MATAVIQQILIKRGKKEVLIAKLKGENRPALGEPIFEIPDTEGALESPKLKIGDGIHNYEDLLYVTNEETIAKILVNGVEVEPVNKAVSISVPTGALADKDSVAKTDLSNDLQTKLDSIEDGAQVNLISEIQVAGTKVEPVNKIINITTATNQSSGVLKLYESAGESEDGTITQKLFTESVNGIKFAIDADDDECLVLEKL